MKNPAIAVPFLAAALLACSLPLDAQTVRVSDAAGLVSAVRGGASLVLLAPGDYGDVKLRGLQPARTVIIRAAVPAQPPRLSLLTIEDCARLRLEGLAVMQSATARNPANRIAGSRDIDIRGMRFRGYRQPDGFSGGNAMMVRASERVQIIGNDIADVGNGIAHLDSRDVLIADNRFVRVREDAIRGGGAQRLTIRGNRATGFITNGVDHADFIQLWSTNTAQPNRDVLIADNLYHRGAGQPVQGIFIRDEKGIGTANIRIERNRILGAMWHGIAVDPRATGVVIRDNMVLGYRDTVVKGKPVTTSWIRAGAGAVLSGNVASRIAGERPDQPVPRGNRERAIISAAEGEALARQ